MAEATTRVVLTGVGVRFHPNLQAVQDVNLTVEPGEFVAMVGPSGCGKSTTLNAIAGLISPLEAAVTGTISVATAPGAQREPARTQLGYVFQRDCLLPWRTIAGNVGLGLEIRGVERASRRRTVSSLLSMVGLTGFEQSFPHQLSGGMRQRAALARSLAYEPQLMLMDEPFGALDAQTRMALQGELLQLFQRRPTTILFVTHDLPEAITLAERVVLFSDRPGTITAEYQVPLPYPRDPFRLRGDPKFVELEAKIWRELGEAFEAGVRRMRAAGGANA